MARETSKASNKRVAAREADPLIARIANSQHGLITTAQLRSLGVSAASVSDRAADGRLHRIFRGVYAVGHSNLTDRARRSAALMTLPAGTVFSHRTAAAMHGLLVVSATAPLEVLVAARSVRTRPGLKVRATRNLDKLDRTVAHGLPVTSVARTLVDLAGALDEPVMRRAFHEAEVARSLDVAAITEVLERLGNRPGTALLRSLIESPPETSERFVEAYLGLCNRHGVPRPAVDVRIDTGLPVLGQADLVYEPQRVIVELDGARTHMTRRRYEEDRRRDSYLSARGWLTLRYTWRRITQDGDAVAREVRATLSLRSAAVMR